MKKGFTMIELIFVIVILGVLAAVAIPKLNATRDDAEQAKAMTNLATLMGDLTSYYTAQGNFDKDITKMTNVPLTSATASGNTDFTDTFLDTAGSPANAYVFSIKNKPCIAFQVDGASLRIVSAKSVDGNPVCKNILGNTATQNILSGSYTCTNTFKVKDTDGNWVANTPDATAGCKEASDDIIGKLKEDKGTSKADDTDDSKAIVTSKIDRADKGIKASFEGAGVKF